MTKTPLALAIATAAAGLTAIAPAMAQARDYRPAAYDGRYDDGCSSRVHDNGAAGAVIGGLAGALIGSNVAHHGGRTGGAVIGAAAGALVGSSIARSSTKQSCRGSDYGYDGYRQSAYSQPAYGYDRGYTGYTGYNGYSYPAYTGYSGYTAYSYSRDDHRDRGEHRGWSNRRHHDDDDGD
jgi:hypothetical protein